MSSSVATGRRGAAGAPWCARVGGPPLRGGCVTPGSTSCAATAAEPPSASPGSSPPRRALDRGRQRVATPRSRSTAAGLPVRVATRDVDADRLERDVPVTEYDARGEAACDGTVPAARRRLNRAVAGWTRRDMEGSGGVTALYRKYRPQDFDEVVGQEAVVRTLRNAIERDQVRQAYLFAGPRGTGKTSMARILAKALNCAAGPTTTPDRTCSACVVDLGRHLARRDRDGRRVAARASTTSARSASASSCSRPRVATRSTSSTRRTSSPTRRGTRS